ncbi:MAG: AAA family ATPase, partial [Acidobacteria bacterium]|nr:AAA family ATPase [Acidobacteriota bacterium]
MKIERLQIGGFGKIRDSQVRFDPDRVNLLVEANEFGKSTVAEAICAALYGFRAKSQDRTTEEKWAAVEAWSPVGYETYHITLDLTVNGHRRRIFRDFSGNEARIFDLDAGGEEITQKFILKKGEAHLGELLLSLSRDQFVQTCFVGQRALEVQSAGTDLKQALERMASTGGASATAAQAIEALQRGLDRLPGAITGKRVSVETEVKELQKQLSKLEENLAGLIESRRRMDPEAAKLLALESEIETGLAARARLERLRIMAEFQEVEAHLAVQQALAGVLGQLQAERTQLEPYAEFPAHMSNDLLDWLGQLRTKTRDWATIEVEIRSGQAQLSELNRELDARFAGMVTFNRKDEETLIGAIARFTTADDALAKAEAARMTELKALQSRNILPARFEELDQRLSNLDPIHRSVALGFREARAQQRMEISRSERGLEEKSRLLQSIDAERSKAKRHSFYLFAIGMIVLLGSIGLYIGAPDSRPLWAACIAIGSLITSVAIGATRRAARLRTKERAKAATECDQLKQEAAKLHEMLRVAEAEMDSFASTAGLESADQLAAECLEHLQMGESLRSFKQLDQERDKQEWQKREGQMSLHPYFRRAGRAPAISEAITARLADEFRQDVRAYFELREKIGKVEARLAGQEISRQRSQAEVVSLRKRLREAFVEAGITEYEGDSYSQAYNIFVERLEFHRRYRKIVEDELPERERRQVAPEQLAAWERTLVDLREALSAPHGEPLPEPAKSHGEYARELQELNAGIDESRKRLEMLRLRVAGTLDDFENRSGALVRERQQLTSQLHKVTTFQQAVILAIEKFSSLAAEVHLKWSESLNGICEEMLTRLDTDYRSIRFADDLSFTVEARGTPAPLQMRDIRQRLSLGAREQLVLLQRLAVSRFLSSGPIKLPLIMDDPLVTSDDERFLRMMQFVVSELSYQHQVLVF